MFESRLRPTFSRSLGFFLAIGSVIGCGEVGRVSVPDPLVTDINERQQTFFVDAETGSDDHSGRLDAPFATIQRGIDALSGGDNLIIRNGTYAEAVALVGKSGTASNFTTIRAAEGHLPVIEALGLTPTGDENSALQVKDSDFVFIQGLFINGSSGHGIGVFNSNQVVIRENQTYNTSQSGIHVRHSEGLRVEDNEIARAVQADHEGCLSIRDAHDFAIRGNLVHDRPQEMSLQGDFLVGELGGEAISVESGSTNGLIHGNRVNGIEGKQAIHIDAGVGESHNINIFNNVVKNSGCAIALSVKAGTSLQGKLSFVRVFNNIGYNGACGLYMGNHGGAPREDDVRRVEDIKIFNNTFHNNAPGAGITIANPNAKRVTIRNNLLTFNQRPAVVLGIDMTELPPDSIIEHNLGYPELGITTSPYNIVQDPQFADPDSGDFRLRPTSPAIDAAVSFQDAPEFDAENQPRPQGIADDLGALEAYTGEPDSDLDGVDDEFDNCTLMANPDQRDTDADGFGNFCDPDLNNDGLINVTDVGIFKAAFFTVEGMDEYNPDADFDGDGKVNVVDFALLRDFSFSTPGPSAVAP